LAWILKGKLPFLMAGALLEGVVNAITTPFEGKGVIRKPKIDREIECIEGRI
jgi:hypothetical protein